MKIELINNKVFFENQGLKKEIHPFWLRERVNGDVYVDKTTQQRLFDPTELKAKIKIDNLKLSNDHLEITFNDGVYTKLTIQNSSQVNFYIKKWLFWRALEDSNLRPSV